MSVFAGGCDLPAFSRRLCRRRRLPALDVLDELVRTSFVVVDSRGHPTRYRLLEPVRQFAGDLLDASGDRDDRQRRHLEHYGEFAGRCTTARTSPGSSPSTSCIGARQHPRRARLGDRLARGC